MSNKDIQNEAKRIASKLIEIGEGKNSLDEIFHEILKIEFKEYDMNVLLHVCEELINKKYIIESTDPLKIKKI